ncbi:Lrp/AsnC ligand binding domain-containing protein [[Eubacterium] cellulosolvens]
MTKAFVLINSDLGKEENLIEEIRSIDDVKEAYLTFGVYDIIAKVQTKNMNYLKELVAFKIRRLKDVRSTLTMTVAEKI